VLASCTKTVKHNYAVSSKDLPCAYYVSAKDFGAVGDGVADDTTALQAALNHAQKNRSVCYVPAGHYRLNGSLVVPPGVTLCGTGQGVIHPQYPTGTVLLAYAGKGNPNGRPLITLQYGATLTKVTIHYPEQQVPPNVIPFPWTIQAQGQLCQVIDVVLTNPYNAIDFGTYPNELHVARNIFGCPLNIGIYINQCYDVGRIENVHFNPNFWKRMALEPPLPTGPDPAKADAYQNEILMPYLAEHLIGFKIGKTDWEYMTNCFVIFAKIGFLFDDFGHGPGNALITQSGSDIGSPAVRVNKTQPHAGVQFVNCQFMSLIEVGPDNAGPLKLSNCGFWPIKTTAEQVVKSGPGTLILNSCHFSDWDMQKQGLPCIRINGGRASITACEFMADKPAILLEPNTTAATISACLFRNDKAIVNKSAATVEQTANTKQ
jgi:hypothetical protein